MIVETSEKLKTKDEIKIVSRVPSIKTWYTGQRAVMLSGWKSTVIAGLAESNGSLLLGF